MQKPQELAAVGPIRIVLEIKVNAIASKKRQFRPVERDGHKLEAVLLCGQPLEDLILALHPVGISGLLRPDQNTCLAGLERRLQLFYERIAWLQGSLV